MKIRYRIDRFMWRLTRRWYSTHLISSSTKVALMRAWCWLTGGHRWEEWPGCSAWHTCAKCTEEQPGFTLEDVVRSREGR